MASETPDPDSTLSATVPQPALPDIPRAEIERAADYAKASRSPATLRAYGSDWALFAAWCDARGIESLPARPSAVATFPAA